MEFQEEVIKSMPNDPLCNHLSTVDPKEQNLTNILQELLTCKNINETNHLGYRPLFVAVRTDNSELVSLFLKNKPVVNVNLKNTRFPEETPLILAARRAKFDILQILLENEADPNVQSGSGESALHVAITSMREDMVKLLLTYGANQDLPDLKNKPHPPSYHHYALPSIFNEGAYAPIQKSLLYNYKTPWNLCQEIDTEDKEGKKKISLILQEHKKLFKKSELAFMVCMEELQILPKVLHPCIWQYYLGIPKPTQKIVDHPFDDKVSQNNHCIIL